MKYSILVARVNRQPAWVRVEADDDAEAAFNAWVDRNGVPATPAFVRSGNNDGEFLVNGTDVIILSKETK